MTGTISVVEIDRDELKARLAAGEIVVVDVREEHEFAAGRIPGAILLPLSRFDPASLPGEAERIVFSCAAGVRSLHAIAMARSAGIEANAHYPGGFKDWLAAGEPVEFG